MQDSKLWSFFQDLPHCFTLRGEDGSLPLHYACLHSKDHALLATLLYYEKSVVNARRGDGLTPLHIVASRYI